MLLKMTAMCCTKFTDYSISVEFSMQLAELYFPGYG